MIKFSFIAPLLYSCFISVLIIKSNVFDLGMNTLTWGIYFANLTSIYILHKLGKVFDKCLERFL